MLGSVLSLLPSAGARQADRPACCFADFYKQFGSRMRLLITGMAPIRRNIGKFFEQMQLPLCESYGMVEAGSITFRSAQSRDYGSVGKLLKGIDVSIEAGWRDHRQPRQSHDPALFPVRRRRK